MRRVEFKSNPPLSTGPSLVTWLGFESHMISLRGFSLLLKSKVWKSEPGPGCINKGLWADLGT